MSANTRRSVGDYNYFDSRATSEDLEEVMAGSFAAPTANMTINGSTAATNLDAADAEGDDRQVAEVLARVERENAAREAADKDYTPRRPKRPLENISAESSKRPKANASASTGTTDTQTILRANPNHPYSTCGEQTKKLRANFVSKIAAYWSSNYTDWPISSAKASKDVAEYTPRDWGNDLLKALLALARASSDKESLRTKLERAFAERRRKKPESTTYVLPADVQAVTDDLIRMQDEVVRSPTIAPTEFVLDGNIPAIQNGPSTPDDDEDTAELIENAIEAFEQHAEPKDAHGPTITYQERMENAVEEAIPSMDAKAFRTWEKRFARLAETCERHEREMAAAVSEIFSRNRRMDD